MRYKVDFDAIDLLYAAHALCAWEPLDKQGLNRNGYRSAKRALSWFCGEIHRATKARIRRHKRAKKRK